MIRAHHGFVPVIADSAYIDESAQVIGDVVVGERSSIWTHVTVRGDVNSIRIGDDTNVQDNAVLHCEPTVFPLKIGNRVTIEHRAVVHGCMIEDDCVIQIGAVVLNGATIGRGSLIGVGAVVAEGAVVPPGSVVAGIPGRVVRQVTSEEFQELRRVAECQIELAKAHRDSR
jgi:carbonic anhydrase/acetyltransferase-like protein (isoleucine patch superfamily)